MESSAFKQDLLNRFETIRQQMHTQDHEKDQVTSDYDREMEKTQGTFLNSRDERDGTKYIENT